eukprot:4337053-Prymnesium_polylepis.1
MYPTYIPRTEPRCRRSHSLVRGGPWGWGSVGVRGGTAGVRGGPRGSGSAGVRLRGGPAGIRWRLTVRTTVCRHTPALRPTLRLAHDGSEDMKIV